jgi:hypothetical protein
LCLCVGVGVFLHHISCIIWIYIAAPGASGVWPEQATTK